MGHKYVKEEETFNTSRNGTVPKPTASEVSAGKFLKADGTWGTGGGGGGGSTVEASEINGNIKIDDVETIVYRPYGNNTILQVDNIPYLSRQCLNPTGFSGYVRERLFGVSFVWNQLVNTNTSSVTIQSGRKYALYQNNSWTIGQSSGSAISVTGGIDKFVDLTLMFGSIIADAIYNMGSAAGIEYLQTRGFLTKTDYAYNAFEMVSTQTMSKAIYDENDNLLATYSLGNDKLNGILKYADGEIIADGDVKESNGVITRNWKEIELSSLTWTTFGNFKRTQLLDAEAPVTSQTISSLILCEKFVEVASATQSASNTLAISFDTTKTLWVSGNSSPSGKMIYKVDSPTTEQTTSFADPMSLFNAAKEEYTDLRNVPCPVGHRTQYMGRSEDVIEVPSMPRTNGNRYMKSIVKDGTQQLVWDEININASLHNYSAVEQVIGTWIDGKPLYEKTISDTSADDILFTSIGAVKEIINCYGRYIIQSNNNVNETYSYNLDNYYDGSYHGIVDVRPTRIKTTFTFGSAYHLMKRWIVIQYTKTTDG